MYKKNDKVIFKVGEESFEYNVIENDQCVWFLSQLKNKDTNSIIFKKLNITDKFKFVRDISKYATDDRSKSFPEIAYPNETEINKVIDALLKKCDEYNKQFNDTTTCYKNGDKTEENVSTETTSQKPIFKEGDYVRVIFKEDVKNGDGYRFGFAPEMFHYCGEIYIVHKVSNAYSEAGSEPDDGMLYILKTVDGNTLPYSFASSMLMPMSMHNIISPQLPFLEKIKLDDSLIDGCIQTTVDSETKMVLKKSTPEYKLKFTN